LAYCSKDTCTWIEIEFGHIAYTVNVEYLTKCKEKYLTSIYSAISWCDFLRFIFSILNIKGPTAYSLSTEETSLNNSLKTKNIKDNELWKHYWFLAYLTKFFKCQVYSSGGYTTPRVMRQ
jgi:hypothetical protein